MFKSCEDLHTWVGNIKTPSAFVDEKNNIEYPASFYMRAIADRYYSPWNWSIKDDYRIIEQEGALWYLHVGRLEWTERITQEDGSIIEYKRYGEIPDAELVKFKKGTNVIVDLGDNAKSANTNTMKKAFNLFCHICNDIYRWPNPQLSLEQMQKLAEALDKSKNKDFAERVMQNLKEYERGDSFLINSSNYKYIITQLEN